MAEDETEPNALSPSIDVKDVAGDDFLFHLYRGSELLQDNRVHEAKQELEQALAVQPRDAKGQDLLAIVYFRLGLYPRAIAIYESLITMYPQSATPRLNLALCYLKTGQAAGARVELERVLELSPRHSRAWGYLGLAFQRLGDYERACHAFLTGGHEVMARRLMDMVGTPSQAPPPHSKRPPANEDSSNHDLVHRAASDALDEIDRHALSADPEGKPFGFQTDEGTSASAPPAGTWAALEPGREREPHGEPSRGLSPSLVPSLAPSESLLPPVSTRMDLDFPLPPPEPAHFDPPSIRGAALRRGDADETPKPPEAHTTPRVPPPSGGPPSILPHLEPPERPEVFARRKLLVFPRLHNAALHPSGLVVLRSSGSVALRFEMVRALSFPAGMTSRMLSRKARGRDLEEPLGGPASPMFELEGTGEVVLGANVGSQLAVLRASSEPLFVREGALAAFEGMVMYESGRLAGSDGDVVPMIQIRSLTAEGSDGVRALASSSGTVVVSLPAQSTALEVTAAKPVLLRTHSILGWTGQITPRNLPPSEAPGRVRGFVALSGEGMVLLDGR